jgi:integration host factor subunit beta
LEKSGPEYGFFEGSSNYSLTIPHESFISTRVMNKAGLIETVRNDTGLTRRRAEDVVDIFFDSIADALAVGDRVEIRGFCSFHINSYRPYTGRNPKTGEPIQVEPKQLPFFKCGKELKQRVDYGQT